MKISPGLSISNNPSITLEPVDAEDTSQGSQIRKSSGTPYVHTLVLNALAYGTYSRANARLNADGNYYTLTFPDDFVQEVNSSDTITLTDQGGGTIPKDPFVGYRADTAPYQIDSRLNITIQIPSSMKIGTNTHAAFMSPFDMNSIYLDTSRNMKKHRDGTNYSSAEKNLRQACADPCILIEFGSHKVTDTTLQNSTLNIINEGMVVGGGGYGGMGGWIQSSKSSNGRGGGGGGAGQGLHQVITPGTVDPHAGQGSEYNLSHTTNVFSQQRTSSLPTLDPSIWSDHADYSGQASEGVHTPRPGQGGLAYWFWPGRTGGAQAGAANGVFSSTWDSALGVGYLYGAGGAGSSSGGSMLGERTEASENIRHATRGGWGGNVVQFKSNASGTFTGSSISITNKDGGYMRGGGGGSVEGNAGGTGYGYNLLNSYVTGQADGAHGSGAGNQWGGLEGQLFINSSANVTISNTFSNERSDNNWMQGRDIRVT